MLTGTIVSGQIAASVPKESMEKATVSEARASDFPIRPPNRLPIKITPCPIVEAVLEIRFITSESWRTLPGIFYGNIRDLYPEQLDLPLAKIPDQLRQSDPALTYQPLVRFVGKAFNIQLGPRSLNLTTKIDQYPGWPAIRNEMRWLLEIVQKTKFVSEGERLSVRYINFFKANVFDLLVLDFSVHGKRLTEGEASTTISLTQKPFVGRLTISNTITIGTGPDDIRHGSILDIDVRVGALDFDVFTNGLETFESAHSFEKQIFFGLLKPDYLASLNPEYV
jgi:uncharacterized protein (TIGR04255 family)